MNTGYLRFIATVTIQASSLVGLDLTELLPVWHKNRPQGRMVSDLGELSMLAGWPSLVFQCGELRGTRWGRNRPIGGASAWSGRFSGIQEFSFSVPQAVAVSFPPTRNLENLNF